MPTYLFPVSLDLKTYTVIPTRIRRRMVEVGGIEPPSQEASGTVSTAIVRAFLRQALFTAGTVREPPHPGRAGLYLPPGRLAPAGSPGTFPRVRAPGDAPIEGPLA